MGSVKYDVEQLIRDLETMFKANLNTKIGDINTQKGDFNISTVNESAWFFQHIPQVWNYPVFVIYGFQDIDSNQPQEDNMVQVAESFFEVVIPDSNKASSEAQVYQLLRYARALREVAHENFDSLRGYAKLTVTSLTPTAIELPNGKSLKASGIRISASISAR